MVCQTSLISQFQQFVAIFENLTKFDGLDVGGETLQTTQSSKHSFSERFEGAYEKQKFNVAKNSSFGEMSFSKIYKHCIFADKRF